MSYQQFRENDVISIENEEINKTLILLKGSVSIIKMDIGINI